ncbi:MAG: hypothetical protein K0B11_05970 [Mariniphaga sp.]|nr:hypothetical protein [Mariniphaga sp.]
MKTKKAQLNQIILATFLFVFLLSGNVEAEGTEWNTVSGLENVTENKLEVEKWMVNEDYWFTEENTFVVETEQDENLVLEAWMFDENKWGLAVFEYASNEKEQDLRLENWMINEMYWN